MIPFQNYKIVASSSPSPTTSPFASPLDSPSPTVSPVVPGTKKKLPQVPIKKMVSPERRTSLFEISLENRTKSMEEGKSLSHINPRPPSVGSSVSGSGSDSDNDLILFRVNSVESLEEGKSSPEMSPLTELQKFEREEQKAAAAKKREKKKLEKEKRISHELQEQIRKESSPIFKNSLGKSEKEATRTRRKRILLCKKVTTTSLATLGLSTLGAGILETIGVLPAIENLSVYLLATTAALFLGAIGTFFRIPFKHETYDHYAPLSKEMREKIQRFILLKKSHEENFENFKWLVNTDITRQQFEKLHEQGASKIKNYTELYNFYHKSNEKIRNTGKQVPDEEEKLQYKFSRLMLVMEKDPKFLEAMNILNDYYDLKDDPQVKFYTYITIENSLEAKKNIRKSGYYSFVYTLYVRNTQKNVEQVIKKIGKPSDKDIKIARKMYGI